MKKNYTLLLLMITSLSFAQAFDVFSPAALSNLHDNGWAIHGGSSGFVQTAEGSLTYPGLTSTGNKAVITSAGVEDVNLASAAPIPAAAKTAYYSALINVVNTEGLLANTDVVGNFFMFMGTGSGAGTLVGSYNVRLYIKTGSIANTFNLGVLNNSGAPITVSYPAVATNYPVGTPLFIVVKYDFQTNAASLYVNPTIGGTEPTTSVVSNATGINAAPLAIGSLGIRQSAGTGNIEIDEVRIGATWAYVTAGTVLKVAQNDIAGLNVYPNPVTNGNLFITSNSSDAKSIAVFDVLGKQVVKKTTANNAVNVSHLKGGTYILKITQNEKTATRKLIIK
jgi:hypothetical protein